MIQGKQIFQTSSSWRWKTFKWTGRLFIFCILLMIPVVIITLARGIQPGLPLLSSETDSAHRLAQPLTPLAMNEKELKKYKGFNDFLTVKKKNDQLIKNSARPGIQNIRAAFYVDWDPQSFYSLEKNIDKLNMVLPEWFFIDPATDTLQPKIDNDALAVMKKNHVRIVPLINNINSKKGAGEFDGSILHRILHN